MSGDDWRLLGYRIYSGSPEALTASILRPVEAREGFCWAGCLNPHSYVVSRSRPSFRVALQSADWVLPDGIGVVLASKFLGGAVHRRITGSDVFGLVNSGLDARGGARIFLLGSTADTLDRIRGRMAREWPRVQVVGMYSPPVREEFGDGDVAMMIDRINAAAPDVLWVGITAPKQEELIWRMRDGLNVRFAGAVGGAFDFYVGAVPRAGVTLQRMGLEWLPRLFREPRRLWRRTFVSAPIFLMHVVRQRLVPERTRD